MGKKHKSMLLDALPPPEKRLRLKNRFSFSCDGDLACFGTCCRNRDLTLTPYDVLRLKNALKLHSDEFLVLHTLYRLDPNSGFPLISLKMGPDPERKCPFSIPEGCSVYSDRPTACRLFPLARVSGTRQNSTEHDEFFFLLDTRNCLGCRENRTQILEEWLAGQGLIQYRMVNDKMLNLISHPLRKRGKALSDKQLQKMIVACYNLDVFREFVFKTDFLDIYHVDQPTRSLIEKDDVELLTLGFTYLHTTLFSQSKVHDLRSKVKNLQPETYNP